MSAIKRHIKELTSWGGHGSEADLDVAVRKIGQLERCLDKQGSFIGNALRFPLVALVAIVIFALLAWQLPRDPDTDQVQWATAGSISVAAAMFLLVIGWLLK